MPTSLLPLPATQRKKAIRLRNDGRLTGVSNSSFASTVAKVLRHTRSELLARNIAQNPLRSQIRSHLIRRTNLSHLDTQYVRCARGHHPTAQASGDCVPSFVEPVLPGASAAPRCAPKISGLPPRTNLTRRCSGATRLTQAIAFI